MTASPVQTPAAAKAASLQATLDALAVVVSDFAADQVADMAARMAADLADVSRPGLETREVYRRVKSAKLLKDNGYAFVHLASNAIEAALRREFDAFNPQASAPKAAASLSLVPLEEIDGKLAFGALARPFDIAHSEALATLSVRLGMLFGRSVLRADANPFRPAVLLEALEQAWREFEPDSEAHCLARPLLRPSIVFDPAPLYERLADVLKRKEGQPGSADAFRFQKTDDAAAARAARASGRAALAEQLRKLFGDDGGDESVPLIPDLPGMPAGTGGWRPSGAAGFAPGGGSGAAPVAGLLVDGASPGGGVPQAGMAAGQAGMIQAQVDAAVHMAPGFVPAAGASAAVPMAGMAPAAGVAAGVFQGMAVAVPGGATAPMPAHALLAPGLAGGLPPGALADPDMAAGNAGKMAQGAAPAPYWAGVPVHGLAAAAAGLAPPSFAALPAAGAAPLLELLARIEPALAAGAGVGRSVQAAALEHGVGEVSGAGGADGARHEASGPVAVPHNVFYLPRLKQSLPRGALSRGDAHTLDLLSRVFETVLLDASIPPQARELLQALQVPVLKAALLDKAFFFEEAHPARRLVDLLSRMGWAQHKDGDDPLFQAMQRSVERVAAAGAAEQGAAVDGAAGGDGFAQAVAGLEASIAEEESAHEQALAAPVASALKQERMAVATRAARAAVALRVDAGDLDDVVGAFLAQRWTTVMTFAYSIEDDKPGAVGNATRAMDDLIWSIKPKATQEQRKALIARLPRLLGTLNKWLDAIRWQDAERLQFFARLAECHASIVRAPIELSPDRQLELAVEAAQQDALRRVELENAAAEQEAARRQAISPVDGLERGMWCEFRAADSGPRKVRLAWVSPLRTLFIFSGAGRREAFSMTAEKLAAALHAGAARVLALDGVVGQVLQEAMRAGNDTVIA